MSAADDEARRRAHEVLSALGERYQCMPGSHNLRCNFVTAHLLSYGDERAREADRAAKKETWEATARETWATAASIARRQDASHRSRSLAAAFDEFARATAASPASATPTTCPTCRRPRGLAPGPGVCFDAFHIESASTEPRRFYIWDARTVVGNEALWWRPDGKGYTTNLDEAGVYPAGAERPTDVFVPVEVARRLVRASVYIDALRAAIKMPYGQPIDVAVAASATQGEGAARCIACQYPDRDKYSAIQGKCQSCGWVVLAKPPASGTPSGGAPRFYGGGTLQRPEAPTCTNCGSLVLPTGGCVNGCGGAPKPPRCPNCDDGIVIVCHTRYTCDACGGSGRAACADCGNSLLADGNCVRCCGGAPKDGGDR